VPAEQIGSFDFSYFLSLFGDSTLWSAAWITVALATVAWAAGAAIGLVVALMGRAKAAPVRLIAWLWVWIFRGVPLLLLIIFAYTAVPQILPSTASFLSDPLHAGALAIVVSESAFMAEIFRGCLSGVPRGQQEAGRALGLTYLPIQRRIVLPQALRIALPPLGNEWIATLKNTSLVSVISLVELTLAAQRIYSQNFLVTETLLAVAVFYLAFATIFTGLQAVVERHLDVTHRRQPSWLAKSVARVPGLARLAGAPSDWDSQPAPSSNGTPLPRRVRSRPRRDRSGEEPVVEAASVTKHFGNGHRALNGVDLTVRRGEVVVLIGRSGCGASTTSRRSTPARSR
jgi:polar amino acid transport system permease protein